MNNLPLQIDHLTSEMVEKAKNELGETAEVRKEALKELRKLLKEEKKLKCPHDDEYLLMFLRTRKYNVKRALNLLQNYYHTKKHRSEVYTYDFDGFKNSLADNFFRILPYRDKDGAAILIIKIENWDYNQRKMNSAVHDLTVAALYTLEYPATQVCGLKLIFDMKSLSPGYIRAIHPKYLIMMVNGIKNCIPIRLKAVHFVNESFIFQHIWNVIKLVLTEKLKSRVHFHSTNMDSLHKHISPDLLPLDYGGKLSYDTRGTLKWIDSQKSVYDGLMSYGYQPGSPS